MVRKLDSNSLTKAKNWRGRNEVTETSGRLHLLWPQNKWLHTPRNMDYRHTRQDRWIQTELVSTLAKNATKPNPFEIILLQTTRKENNWKTEETLERAVVTLETERIKRYNPWCLRWWWVDWQISYIRKKRINMTQDLASVPIAMVTAINFTPLWNRMVHLHVQWIPPLPKKTPHSTSPYFIPPKDIFRHPNAHASSEIQWRTLEFCSGGVQ